MAQTRQPARLTVQPLEDRATPAVMFPVLSGEVVATGKVSPNIDLLVGASPALIALDFDPSRVATADVNGDGTADFITVTKPGEVVRVKVQDGKEQSKILIDSPFVFESTFRGGGRVDAGDLDGDGKAEIVVSADVGGSGRVVVLRPSDFGVTLVIDTFVNDPGGIGGLAVGTLTPLASFFGIEDANFRGGSVVAVEDMNNDGRDDIIVGAGVGGGPRVAIYDGPSVARSLVQVTSQVRYQGNIGRDKNVGDTIPTSIQIVDSSNALRTLNVGFRKTAANTYAVTASVAGATVTVPDTPLLFDAAGTFMSPESLTITIEGLSGVNPQNITLHFGTPGSSTGLTQFGGFGPNFNSVAAVTQDGVQAGFGIQKLVNDFFATPDIGFRGGISVDAGDVDGDGKADLIVGAGVGGGQRTRVISGVDIRASKGATAAPLADFLLGGRDDGNRFGVLVAYEPPYEQNKFGGLGVFGSFLDISGKQTIGGGVLFIGKNFPKPPGTVPDIDERVFVQ